MTEVVSSKGTAPDFASGFGSVFSPAFPGEFAKEPVAKILSLEIETDEYPLLAPPRPLVSQSSDGPPHRAWAHAIAANRLRNRTQHPRIR
jgi:hypothetical protein